MFGDRRGNAINWAIDLTARLRYSLRWEDGRALLRRRGVDPLRCVVAYMGPGGSGPGGVCCELILPDGRAVVLDFEADRATERMISIEDFEEVRAGAESREVGQVRELLRTEGESFDERVRSYFAEICGSL